MRDYVEYLEECERWGDEPSHDGFHDSLAKKIRTDAEEEEQ